MSTELATDQATKALQRLPQRRPASLYDVAVQYSIFDWYETVTSGDLDFDLLPEHLMFMTPAQKDGLFGEPDNVLVAYVDLSDPEDPRFRDDRPIRFESVDASLRFKLGHSYPQKKTSNRTDYSITTHKEATEYHLAGQREDTYWTNNIIDRFTDWPYSEAAEHVLDREDVEEKWILRALRELGSDRGRLDELVNRNDVPLDPEDDETEHEVFVTVRIKLPNKNRYHWPGEIPILNEVMIEQKTNRLDSISVENASGDGVGYVSGKKDWVTGGSAGLLGMYAKEQREHFADLSPDGSAAWCNRPLTRETAAAIATANSVFDGFYEGLENDRRLYVLPYLSAHPDNIAPSDFDAFVEDVFSHLRNREDTSFQGAIGEVFYDRENDDHGDPLFNDEESTAGPDYGQVEVATIFQVTGNPNRVFFEDPAADVYRPREIDDTHDEVLASPVFQDDGIFASIRDRSNSPLLALGSNRSNMALFGSYFDWTTEPTRTSDEAQETPKAGDIDDVRARRLEQFLSGEEVPLRTLLEEYLHLLVQRQRGLFDEGDGNHVPARQVAEQYAQLCALEEIDALGTSPSSSGKDPGVQSTTTHDTNFAPVTESQLEPDYQNRTDRLEDFIDSHEVLRNSEPRQAVFLLGGLVGRISAYQRRESVSSTLVRRYPIDYLTKQSIKEVTNEVIQMNNTYAESEDNFSSSYNARYTDRLPDLMLASDPSDWSITQNELQWIYALGITYGTKDTQIDTED